METKPIFEFPAINQSFFNPYIVVSLAIVAACVGASVWARRKKDLDATRRNMLVMVFTFVGLAAACMAGIKVISIFRLKPVAIFADSIQTPYGKIEFNELKDASIEPFYRYKPMQAGVPVDSTRYLSLFKRSGTEPDILSEGDYPIDSIFDALQKTIGR